jgi:transcriptional regulator of acetoin/glycerol metabolism
MVENLDYKKIEQAWSSYFEKNNLNIDGIRKEILESWKRSKDYNINPININNQSAPQNIILQKRCEKKYLIDIAKPYMENIYDFVKNSGFIVFLTDEEGFTLESIVDKNNKKQAELAKHIIGTTNNEKNYGTNSVGTCLHLNEPIQIAGSEHYFKEYHNWTCSAAPIHDLKGNIIGCLNMTGPLAEVHSHTLGMVVAVVDGIEKTLTLNNYLKEITIKKNQLTNITHANSDGIIFVNKFGKIELFNNRALNILMIKDKDIENKDFHEFINDNSDLASLIDNENNVYDREITIDSKGRHIYCTLSALTVCTDTGGYEGILFVIKDSKHVHKLVNRLSGSQAKYTFESIIGSSKKLYECKRIAKLAANTSSNILLLGESGTGKELIAQSIHNFSDKRNGPFIAINCGALPRGLIESELFGYEGGSFTGSSKDGRPGKFELADGGTIFLDEIGDTPLDVQVTLLRVLENKEVVRIGGNKAKKIDVRVIAATNKNLSEEIRTHSFRTDLFYRLNVFSIKMPPLRERTKDIEDLIYHFIEKYSIQSNIKINGIDKDALELLLNHTWPGNVRELENTIERSVYISLGSTITIYDLPQTITNIDLEDMPAQIDNINSAYSEKESIINALKSSNGIVIKTAVVLNMNRRTLYRKMKKHNIDYNAHRK